MSQYNKLNYLVYIAITRIVLCIPILFLFNFLLNVVVGLSKKATIYITRPTTELGMKPTPVMAAFSSIGPNRVTPKILKVFYHFDIVNFKSINQNDFIFTSIYMILSFPRE